MPTSTSYDIYILVKLDFKLYVCLSINANWVYFDVHLIMFNIVRLLCLLVKIYCHIYMTNIFFYSGQAWNEI